MKRTLGLAAAAAASLGTVAGTPAQAAAKVGSIYVSMDNGEPTVGIFNATGSTFTGVMLIGTWDGGLKHATTTVQVGSLDPGVLPAHGSGSIPLGTFPHAFSALNSITSNVTFKVVGNQFVAASFGGTVSGTNWLVGNVEHTYVGSQLAANLYGVPEPATVLMLVAGVAGLGAARRRRL